MVRIHHGPPYPECGYVLLATDALAFIGSRLRKRAVTVVGSSLISKDELSFRISNVIDRLRRFSTVTNVVRVDEASLLDNQRIAYFKCQCWRAEAIESGNGCWKINRDRCKVAKGAGFTRLCVIPAQILIRLGHRGSSQVNVRRQ